jgi:transposase
MRDHLPQFLVFRRAGRVIADRSHVHVLKTPREVRNAIAYVLLNARRHRAKQGRRPSATARVDPASSGRWFSGWRRRGLIDSAEVPGCGSAANPG